jgi:hypothetical protein
MCSLECANTKYFLRSYRVKLRKTTIYAFPAACKPLASRSSKFCRRELPGNFCAGDCFERISTHRQKATPLKREGYFMSIMNKFSMHGKVAVVTGGNRSIGRAIAIGLGEAELRSLSRPATKRRAKKRWRNFASSASPLSRYPRMSRTAPISKTWSLR